MNCATTTMPEASRRAVAAPLPAPTTRVHHQRLGVLRRDRAVHRLATDRSHPRATLGAGTTTTSAELRGTAAAAPTNLARLPATTAALPLATSPAELRRRATTAPLLRVGDRGRRCGGVPPATPSLGEATTPGALAPPCGLPRATMLAVLDADGCGLTAATTTSHVIPLLLLELDLADTRATADTLAVPRWVHENDRHAVLLVSKRARRRTRRTIRLHSAGGVTPVNPHVRFLATWRFARTVLAVHLVRRR